MISNNESRLQGTTTITKRAEVTSYDSCYEHSVEHWIELRRSVQEFNEETIVICKAEMAMAAGA